MSENRISDEWLEHYRAFTAKVDETRDEKGVICDARQICAMATELQQRRQQDAARDVEYNAATEMFAALERLCEAVRLYFEGGDKKREEALHELYFGREHSEASLKAWEEANDVG